MLDEQLIKLIDATSEILGLDRSVIEKDFYVTKAIQVLSNIEDENFCLVFAGGTCLAKAHKIVMRMSEDIDFKVKIKNTYKRVSKSQFIKDLKKFRALIIETVNDYNFNIDNIVTRNEGNYLKIELMYTSVFPSNKVLRTHILLEFTVAKIRLEIEKLYIKTLIEDNLTLDPIFDSKIIFCVSCEETAIEKWVGLTRRIIAIERGYHTDDPTLVRHIYDLNAISAHNRINDSFFNLAASIINNDALQFKNQHPEYFDNPCLEIKQSIEILKINNIWQERYQDFLENMVYDQTPPREYYYSIETIENISAKITQSFEMAIV